MANLIVVNKPRNWPFHIPDVPVISARDYLTDPKYYKLPGLKVFNLCRQYAYQSLGYYVSLLAMARGQKPLPSITTIQDMKAISIARIVADDLDDLIQHSLAPLRSNKFTLSIYFGRNLAKRYDDLSLRLFRLFPAPLLRADFVREREDWRMQNISPLPAAEIPEDHRDFVVESAQQFFAENRFPSQRRRTHNFDLAILVNPDEKLPPSNKTALRHFTAAAKRHGFSVTMIDKRDFGRVGEFDALFIRETTYVNHHTYRFARRALADGLVVIDDPESIAKCTNKVYLAELLTRHRVPIPQTVIVHRDNRQDIATQIGLPCILKLPDSSFSQGVVKASDRDELRRIIDEMLEESDLIVAQEFIPTDYDWRVGLIDREPLYACRYYMVKQHWQIYKQEDTRTRDGAADGVPMDQVPPAVLRTATRAARLIGDGLYGVDLKHRNGKVYVIEINDNPSIDAGCEDVVLKQDIYDRIMAVFQRRVEAARLRREGGRP